MLIRLRTAREQAGLSQAEVAEALRRPLDYVARCEAGIHRIDPLELSDFAALYGKSIDHFVEIPRNQPHQPGRS